MTHYQTLRVPPTATAAEIKKSYRTLAKKHHPDFGGDPVIFARISAAYEVLGDPTKKAHYDADLASQRYQRQQHRPPPRPSNPWEPQPGPTTYGETFQKAATGIGSILSSYNDGNTVRAMSEAMNLGATIVEDIQRQRGIEGRPVLQVRETPHSLRLNINVPLSFFERRYNTQAEREAALEDLLDQVDTAIINAFSRHGG